MTRGIYLRANGNLPCYCGNGCVKTLGKIVNEKEANNFAKLHYFGNNFQYIRDCMEKEIVPFPGICEQCVYLEVDSPTESEKLHQEIDWLHWEPSYLCNLDCQWCSGEKQRRKEQRNTVLQFEIFQAIIDSLSQNNLKLNKGNVCGQGEPTLNKNVWKMIQYVKQKLKGDILISTNGNTPFLPEIVTCGLDKIKIAIDGITQEKYNEYRKNGSLDKILKLTKQIVEYKKEIGSKSPIIIWQYIIFNYNSSKEELLEFQNMAFDYGVDMIRVVYTKASNYSKQRANDFPVIFPNILIEEYNRKGRIPIDELYERQSIIEQLMTKNELKRSSIDTLKLLNICYNKLFLGVETYNEQLEFTKKISRVKTGSLSKNDYIEIVNFMNSAYQNLINIYFEMGFGDQADKYQTYLNQLTIEMD